MKKIVISSLAALVAGVACHQQDSPIEKETSHPLERTNQEAQPGFVTVKDSYELRIVRMTNAEGYVETYLQDNRNGLYAIHYNEETGGIVVGKPDQWYRHFSEEEKRLLCNLWMTGENDFYESFGCTLRAVNGRRR